MLTPYFLVVSGKTGDVCLGVLRHARGLCLIYVLAVGSIPSDFLLTKVNDLL